MSTILAETYKKGQALGYAEELGKDFQPGKDGLSAAKIKKAVFELGKIGGISLAESHRHGLIAFTSANLTQDEASDLYKLQIPTNFYPDANHGIFTEEGLNKFVDYLSKQENQEVLNELIESITEILAQELNLQATKDYMFKNVPFFVKHPVHDTIDILAKNSADQALKELKFFDLDNFLALEASDREILLDESMTLMQKDVYSSLADTVGNTFDRVLVKKNLTKDQAVQSIINLQKVIRQYTARADSILNGDEF